MLNNVVAVCELIYFHIALVSVFLILGNGLLSGALRCDHEAMGVRYDVASHESS